MQRKIWNMILIVALPLMIVIIAVAAIGVGYALQYNEILNNVTTASDFNRNFKENIDLKMYYYVIDSQYSEGLPIEEVQLAEAIARKLIDTTTEKDSLRSINSVLSLCQNLEAKIYQIKDTKDYNSRMDQLNNNIYIDTELIQDYMYQYLYYEAVHLDALQTAMITRMIFLMGAVTILSLVLLYFLLTNSKKLSHRIVDPIDMICERLEDIGQGSLLVCKPIQADVEEVQLLSDGIESMVGRLKQLIEMNAEQENSAAVPNWRCCRRK